MKNLIPEQHEGGQMDTISKAVFTSVSAAKEFFATAKHKLLDISNWGSVCQVPLSVFTLTDDSGNKINREAMEGDYIRIDIPGPGTSTGDGFDWVRIEKISEEQDENNAIISLLVRPSANPAKNEEEIAHFFKSMATSTFELRQIGNAVYAAEHGRNEVPNTDTSSLSDNLRNRLVGWSAKIGLSYPQWKSLVKGLVETDASTTT